MRSSTIKKDKSLLRISLPVATGIYKQHNTTAYQSIDQGTALSREYKVSDRYTNSRGNCYIRTDA